MPETIIDYALPAMNAEKALRLMHEAALERKYEEAQEHALTAIAETRLALQSLKHMAEQ